LRDVKLFFWNPHESDSERFPRGKPLGLSRFCPGLSERIQTPLSLQIEESPLHAAGSCNHPECGRLWNNPYSAAGHKRSCFQILKRVYLKVICFHSTAILPANLKKTLHLLFPVIVCFVQK
jgi:hypothetical protein